MKSRAGKRAVLGISGMQGAAFIMCKVAYVSASHQDCIPVCRKVKGNEGYVFLPFKYFLQITPVTVITANWSEFSHMSKLAERKAKQGSL